MTDQKIDLRLQTAPLDLPGAAAFTTVPEAGGVVTFVGNVRDSTAGRRVLHLDFEAYEPMALREMRKIAKTVCERFDVRKIAFYHRLGRLDITETAVLIGVACPHRDAAFAACRYAIDTLKETVPIWKKEYFADGEVWVSAHP